VTELATLQVDDRIARLIINRPDKRNALSVDLLEALLARADELRRMNTVSVVVLAGAGGVFCAGMDLKAVLKEPGAPLKLLSAIAELTIRLRTLPKVVIADVRGAAIGGGCGLATVCDISVTHPEAKLGFPEVDLGVCPAVVAPWLVQAVGPSRARRILMEGGTMSGQRAAEVGIVGACVPKDEQNGHVEALVARIAEAGPRALAETKRLLNDLEAQNVYDAVRRGAKVSADVIAGEEAQSRLSRLFGS
jgi:methylglutaconyl-CoA hydratase